MTTAANGNRTTERNVMSPTKKVTLWIKGDLVTVTIPATYPNMDKWGNEVYPAR